ncbi:MAG: hypothetical protein ACI9Y7_003005 [Dokdonia sp.]|jgi:hypothetical protein
MQMGNPIKGIKKLYFYNCIFEGYSQIKNCEAEVIEFIGCSFKNDPLKLELNKSNLLSITFSVTGKININGLYNDIFISNNELSEFILKDVNNEYSLSESEIVSINNKIKKFKIISSSLYSKIKFNAGNYDTIDLSGTFNESILLEGEVEVKNLILESSIFKNRIDINEGIYKYITFYRSVFDGLIWFNSYDVLTNSERNLKIHSLSIHSNNFEKNYTLSLSQINTLDLSNNNFKKLFTFNSKKPETTSDDNSTMMSMDGVNQGNIVVEDANLHLNISGVNLGNMYFKNIATTTLHLSDFQNNGNISFSDIIFGNFFVINKSTVGKLAFLNTNLEIFDELVISDSSLSSVDFSNYPFNIKSYSTNPQIGYGLKDKSLNKTNLKNVYNQLKKSAKNKGDIDTANRYQSLEYRYLLFSKKIGFDKVLLFLNWISNNFGRSWFQGMFFTFLIAFACFLGYLNILQKDFFYPDLVKDYIFFISSFPKLELDKFSVTPKIWDISLIIWISRIFISYGIYQTIAAFRKYGKS